MRNKKKAITVLVALIVLAAGAYWLFLIPRKVQKKIAVPYNLGRTGEQINLASNLVKWYIPFTALGKSYSDKKNQLLQYEDQTLQIKDRSSVSATLVSKNKNQSKKFAIWATPDSGGTESTVVYLSYLTSNFNHLFNRSALEINAEKSLDNLKSFMEDSRQFYGYQIETSTVEDTSFLFLSTTVPATEKRAATKKLFEKLIAYSEKINAGYNGTRIFYASAFGRDQIMLFASIGISKHIELKPDDEFKNKRMPPGKNLLVAMYQGPYAEVSKAYAALEEFKTDHKLSSMAIPYQKIISDGYDFADDQVVQLKIYYPIF